jgi:lipopolysaccharide export system protein LptC
MSASDSPDVPAPAPRVHRRSQLVSTLRVVLPAFAIGLTLLVIAWSVVDTLRSPSHETAPPPLTVASPRLMGQDDKDRPYVITATTATREPGSVRRIALDHPILSRDPGGPDALHVTAASGVYDETAGKLALDGGVNVQGARGQFATPHTVYDTKTGDLVGGGIQGMSDIGQVRAGGFSASDKGKSVVYKGGVRARLNVKKK